MSQLSFMLKQNLQFLTGETPSGRSAPTQRLDELKGKHNGRGEDRHKHRDDVHIAGETFGDWLVCQRLGSDTKSQ